MAVLNFDIQPADLPNNEQAKVVFLSGSIDASTNQSFESQLGNILSEGTNKVLLVLTNVKYINSTGLGTIVKCVDNFREQRGDIKLVGVPTKVIALFEMLGLLALFETYNDIDEAVASFAGAGAEAAATPAIQFPIQFKHPKSGMGLNVNQPGRFKDPRSGDYFNVTPEGQIEFYEMKKVRMAEIKIHCDASFDTTLSNLVENVANSVGLPDSIREAVCQAMTNAWILVSKNAKDASETCNVIVVGDEEKLQVGILNYDTALNIAANDNSLNTLKQCVDDVKHVTLPSRGHLLVMIKRK
jgi:anti-anti-sigma factor